MVTGSKANLRTYRIKVEEDSGGAAELDSEPPD
jgi:hypothetical protein